MSPVEKDIGQGVPVDGNSYTPKTMYSYRTSVRSNIWLPTDIITLVKPFSE